MMKMVVWLLAAMALAWPAGAAGQDAEAPQRAPFVVKLGGDLPDLRAAKTDGSMWEPAAGAKATVVLLFACESGLCLELLPAVNEFVWRHFEGQGIEMVGIARDATAEEAAALAAEHGIGFPLIPDPDRVLASRVAENGAGVPRIVIADGEGEVVYLHSGYRPGREAEWRRAIQAVLNGESVASVIPMEGSSVGPVIGERELAADMVGRELPPFEVEEWITEAPGEMEGKYVMTEFWATWCGPCVASMPHLEEMWKQHGDKLVIRSISDEEPDYVRGFVKARGFTYPIAVDTQRRLIDALKVRGIPHAYISNPDGIVVWHGHPMELEGNGKELLKRILAGELDPETKAAE